MHVLVRGDLKTREKVIEEGPREESYREEANRLNKEHYESCYLEYFGKSANGDYTPNKRYIWFSRELRVGGDTGVPVIDSDDKKILCIVFGWLL